MKCYVAIIARLGSITIFPLFGKVFSERSDVLTTNYLFACLHAILSMKSKYIMKHNTTFLTLLHLNYVS